ncbi:MAG: hypothetical protein AABZ60_10815, partial [Planctomycetota bacterium]
LENPPRLDRVSTPKSVEGQGFATAEIISPNHFRILSWAELSRPSKSISKKQWEWTIQIQNARAHLLERKLLISRLPLEQEKLETPEEKESTTTNPEETKETTPEEKESTTTNPEDTQETTPEKKE